MARKTAFAIPAVAGDADPQGHRFVGFVEPGDVDSRTRTHYSSPLIEDIAAQARTTVQDSTITITGEPAQVLTEFGMKLACD